MTSTPEISTVAATLRRAAAQAGNGPALVIGQQRLTHSELLQRAREFAAALHGIGVRPGDHVGILMPNCMEYLLLFHGCALLGARPVHLNARYKRDDLRYVIADSDMRVLFTSAKQREFTDFEAMLRDIYPELAAWRAGEALSLSEAPRLRAIYLLHGDGGHPWPALADFTAAGLGHESFEENQDPEQIALIMYTSGTTARPKACLLSNRSLEFVGHSLAARWHMSPRDRFWDPLPFFHMSTMLPLAACRASGATFIAQEHFDAGESVREIVDERATILFPSFPTLTNALFTHPLFDPHRFAAVRIVNNVGPPDLLRRFAAMLPEAAHVSAYGLTEAGGVIAFNAAEDTLEERTETSGHPFAGIEVKIVDPESLQEVRSGESGEILIRGPSLFSGYHNDEERTRQVMAPGGWLRSGDLGALAPGGRIRYLGRLKDMLKVGGENVAAIEIEGYLCLHPAVKMAQVVSAPDDRLVEVPAAFIELHEGARLTVEEVIDFCRGRIASFKIPRYVYFVTEWPMSATKIQKFRLRESIRGDDKIDPAKLK
jgi:fatty-acyl-CoA synthase